jgi:hypothetical protein
VDDARSLHHLPARDLNTPADATDLGHLFARFAKHDVVVRSSEATTVSAPRPEESSGTSSSLGSRLTRRGSEPRRRRHRARADEVKTSRDRRQIFGPTCSVKKRTNFLALAEQGTEVKKHHCA